jgi:hypothetical protein
MDPVAAMFRNQDECGYDDAVYYQPTGSPKNNARDDAGWVPATEMFPPGVAPDPACCIGGALEGGGYATESRFLTLPDTLEPGDYSCLVRLDSPDDIGENDESNNARSALKRLTIVAP